MFQTTSPNNNRLGIADVLILLTDGKPNAKDGKETERALEEIFKLHQKNIQIIGIAIGEATRKQTQADAAKFLEKAVSSPDLLFKADKFNMDAIMNKLVAASCKPIQKGNAAVKITKYKSKTL